MAYNHQLMDAPLAFTKGVNEKDGDRHFSSACCDSTRGDGFKLKRINSDSI